jgi:hypothetical protein
MNRHHPNRVERRRGIADDLDIAAREPVEETLERRRGRRLEFQRAGEQILDRVPCFRPQRRRSLRRPPSAPRGSSRRMVRVDNPPSRGSRGASSASPHGARSAARAAFAPTRRKRSSWVQPNKGETSRLARLRSSSGWTAKRRRRKQVLNRERRRKEQAIDAGHGTPSHRAAPRRAEAGRRAADEDHMVLGTQRASLNHRPAMDFQPMRISGGQLAA